MLSNISRAQRLAMLLLAAASATAWAQTSNVQGSAAPPAESFSYLAAGMTVTVAAMATEDELSIGNRPACSHGILLRRRPAPGRLELAVLTPAGELTRLAEVSADRLAVAADGSDRLWLALTRVNDAEEEVTTLVVLAGLATAVKSNETPGARSPAAPALGFTSIGEGIEARFVADVEADPFSGWRALDDLGGIAGEARLGLLEVEAGTGDEGEFLRPGEVSLTVIRPDGSRAYACSVLLPWSSRDGTWPFSALADPGGGIWLNARQERGRRFEQWWRVSPPKPDANGERSRARGVQPWNGRDYPPLEASAFKDFADGLSVTMIDGCASLQLSGVTVSSVGRLVAEQGPMSRVAFNLLRDDGRSVPLFMVWNLPEWSYAVGFDDTVWLLSAHYWTGEPGGMQTCRQLWRIDGLASVAEASPRVEVQP